MPRLCKGLVAELGGPCPTSAMTLLHPQPPVLWGHASKGRLTPAELWP